jgi:Tfp pilus assembly protein PilF
MLQDRSQEVEEKVEGLLAGEPVRPAVQPKEQAPGPDYEGCIQQAKAAVETYDFESAVSWAQAAVAQDTSRPEAFNLLGVLLERRGARLEAQRYYRAALALDPTYKPAWSNLDRSTQNWPQGGIDLGEGPQKAKKKTK